MDRTAVVNLTRERAHGRIAVIATTAAYLRAKEWRLAGSSIASGSTTGAAPVM